MFKKIASDALGLSDIGTIIGSEDYDKVDATNYIMDEDGEKIYFLIKSMSDEYCFTNLAFIHVDGTSAVSKKRRLKRYDYKTHHIDEVVLETAGTVDLDVEIEFSVGDNDFKIDVGKRHIDELKFLYKALLKISSIQAENRTFLAYSQNSLDKAVESIGRFSNQNSNATVAEQYVAINQYSFDWARQSYISFARRDFGDIFEKFVMY